MYVYIDDMLLPYTHPYTDTPTHTHKHRKVGLSLRGTAARVGGLVPMQHHLRIVIVWFQSCDFVFQAGLPSPQIPVQGSDGFWQL